MQGLKSIGMFTEFWKITKELNPQAIEQEASQQFRIVITGDPSASLGWLRDALIEGRPEGAAVVAKPISPENSSVEGLPAADLYVYLAKPGARLLRDEADAIHRLDARGNPVVLVLARSNDYLSDEEVKLSADLVLGTIPFHRIAVINVGNQQHVDEKVLPTILESVPHLQMSLAKQLPRFRAVVAQQVIRETSRVNAEFALLSSIPANIPILGTLVATGADVIVLTKNQVMMLFKLAAIHDRDLSEKMALATEIAPVVGGAFLWRSLARTLVEVLPGFIAAVPKTAVAAVGTYVVGSIALYYYQMGKKPDGKTVAQFKRDGLDRAGKLIPEIQRRLAELGR